MVQRMVWGYVLLIGLAILQELLVYIHVFREQSLAIVDLGFSIGCLAALLLGFLARPGPRAVFIFVLYGCVFRMVFGLCRSGSAVVFLVVAASGQCGRSVVYQGRVDPQ
ncbi:hypothetical protein HMSSN036_44160 [Paenibacillus macerans]|nr:hypothetical protein HMSSN036_44160 [Paenibacillus macerans]